MFIDEIKVNARAGHGGKGCVAFLRETFRPKGGPSGGNGGRGGDVILEADHDRNNLIDQYYLARLHAEDGQGGMGKGMDGLAGKDLIVKVPCGTLVWKLPSTPTAETEAESLEDVEPPVVAKKSRSKKTTDSPAKPLLASSTQSRSVIRHSGSVRAVEINLEDEGDSSGTDVHDREKGELIADLTENGQRFVLCKGGRGGLGNRNFATSRRQTPRFAQPGEPGGEGDYLLELRILADIGLVGYPNAGKSTLLSAISHARPKIAPYPFTTLTPQIGILEYTDWKRLTICDVPGLIAGAHLNVGLGHAFLRHIRRCKVLVILVDMAGTDDRQPWEDYRSLLEELELYDPELIARPRLIAANKMDEPAAAENLKAFKRKVRGQKVLEIAAAFDVGIPEFKKAIRKAVESV